MDYDDALRADVLNDLQREPMAFYEVVYAANSLFPALRASERLAAAERVLVSLTSERVVSVWWGQWVGLEHERAPVPDEEVSRILRAWQTWSPEAGQSGVWMALRSLSPRA